MKFSPAPFLFLPGILLIGYWVGDIPGLEIAGVCSLMAILLATVFHASRALLYQRAARVDGNEWPDEPAVISPEISN